ncbi:MAG TPA: ABC transporter substrate-binding protein [bacterium]|nr:ABC transporter substrate-binding protein [bacterium]
MRTHRLWNPAAAVASLAAVLALLTASGPAPGAPAAGGVLTVPMPIYRTGAYAAGGSGFAGGREDYFALLNARGGLDGLRIQASECEDAYDTARGVECYERTKRDMVAVWPASTGITYALVDRTIKDQIPMITVGYGRSDATDGKTFPWIFPVLGNYWSQASSFIRYIAAAVGGENSLKGKRIALLHLDIPYGREPIPMFQALSAQFGYEFRNFPLPAPGLEQTPSWVDMARRFRADYVIQWNFGQSCTVPFTAMREVAFPIQKFMGVWWCGSEEDVRPAADLAKGYVTSNFTGVGRNFPVVQQILATVYKAGKGNIDEARVGTVYYNRGIIEAAVFAEAVHNGVKQFGLPVTGAKVRWGLEHLNFSDARLRELGLTGLIPPVQLTPDDHGGVSSAYFQRWDGTAWVRIPGLWQPYADLVRAQITKSAEEYRQQKH